jgi:hypothetical protein
MCMLFTGRVEYLCVDRANNIQWCKHEYEDRAKYTHCAFVVNNLISHVSNLDTKRLRVKYFLTLTSFSQLTLLGLWNVAQALNRLSFVV